MIRTLITAVICGLSLSGATIETTETDYLTTEETETEVVYAIPHTDDEFEILSRIISAEAGNCEWDMMLYVGSVFLNRVASDKFPNTFYEVAFQTNPPQYTPTINGAYWNEVTEGAKEVTEYLLRYGSQAPADVLYQANFIQGRGEWKHLSTSYSTMYFCYG